MTMKDILEYAEPESSLDLEAQRIERVERFRLRKVITVEDLLEALGYTEGGSLEPRRETVAEPPPCPSRSLGRSWGFRAATGRRSPRGPGRILGWLR